MKKAGDLLAYFFDQKTLASIHTWSKLFSAWPSIVTKHKIAAAESHTRVVEFDRRVLLIEAEHPGWIQILQIKQSELLHEFQSRFPDLDIVGISFRLSRTPFAPSIQTPEPRPPEMSPAPEAVVDEDTANLSDKERFERSMKRLEQSIIARERTRTHDFNKEAPKERGIQAHGEDVATLHSGAWIEIKHCLLCPRHCGVNRTAGERGYCGESAKLRLAVASIHHGEEPLITGTGGSGAIFVSGCNLGCVFCQNHQISHEGMGREVDITEFVAICLKLQALGAENINIVTGTHAIPAIVAGLKQARADGLVIPTLWNSSAYESLEALSLLDDVIDVYLPDLKTLDPNLGARFFNAPDYPEYATKAILRMLDTRVLRVSASSTLRSGVIIRHLVLPGYLEATRETLRWFAEHCQGQALISVMTQYTLPRTIDAHVKDAPKRCMSEREYETVLGWLEEFDIEDGFYQELASDSDWLPDFTRQNPFSSTLSTTVWHFQSP
jgi:putative pyruvate formate lyase activating enzyme